MPENEYGERIRKARDVLDFKQRAFGEAIGLNETNVHDLESGRKKLTPELAVLIEKIHGINFRWLLTGEGEMFVGKELDHRQINTATAGDKGVAIAGNKNNVQTGIPQIPNESPRQMQSSTYINVLSNNSINVLNNNFINAIVDLKQLTDNLANAISDTVNGYYEKIRSFFSGIPDRLALWKARNVYKILEIFRGLLSKRDIKEEEIRHVENRITVALIEYGSLVEDEIIQEMWATLLANAADPNFDPKFIHPAYINVLSNLAPLDAFILDKFSELDRQMEQIAANNENPDARGHIWLEDDDEVMVDFNKAIDAESEATWFSIDNLERLGLVNIASIRIGGATMMGLPVNPNPVRKIRFRYPNVTEFGKEFLRACTV